VLHATIQFSTASSFLNQPVNPHCANEFLTWPCSGLLVLVVIGTLTPTVHHFPTISILGLQGNNNNSNNNNDNNTVLYLAHFPNGSVCLTIGKEINIIYHKLKNGDRKNSQQVIKRVFFENRPWLTEKTGLIR